MVFLLNINSRMSDIECINIVYRENYKILRKTNINYLVLMLVYLSILIRYFNSYTMG